VNFGDDPAWREPVNFYGLVLQRKGMYPGM